MLDLLTNKLGDIYVGLLTGFATGIPCTIFGLLIDRWLKGQSAGEGARYGSTEHPQGLTVTQAVSVSVRMSSGATGTSDPIPYIVAAVACITYLFFREEILTAATFLTFVLLGLCAGAMLSSLYRGYLRGASWLLYLAGMLVFPVLLVTVVVAARVPTYAPLFFVQWQQYVQAYGIVGLAHAKVFGPQEFLWFALHVAGVMAMFWAILEAVLSMSFYAFVSGVTADDQSGWLMRRAARYGRNPLRRFVGLVVLLVLAYALVDGVAFVFMTQKLPVLAQELLNHILYGARGSLR
ncbi:hypothetical protein [Ralstonia sp. AU12-08]|nr:hypothetical protein [Ralstonia sp. AU12-08]EPX98411.1 hypothetical protein C404_08450 [Ralstonia sp. AU12-08]